MQTHWFWKSFFPALKLGLLLDAASKSLLNNAPYLSGFFILILNMIFIFKAAKTIQDLSFTLNIFCKTNL